MRMTQGWTGLRNAVIALGLFVSAQTGTKADSLLGYSTAGAISTSVSNDGVTGANVISFVPLTNGQVNTSSNVPLGYFQVAAQGAAAQTTYTNTPFSITFIPGSLGTTSADMMPLKNAGAVTITGVLNGTEIGASQSNVIATFTTPSSGSFQLGSTSSTLSIPQSQLLLVPSTAGNGETTVAGVITSSDTNPIITTPEPSTIALFLSTIGGLGLRKFVQRRRQQSGSALS